MIEEVHNPPRLYQLAVTSAASLIAYYPALLTMQPSKFVLDLALVGYMRIQDIFCYAVVDIGEWDELKRRFNLGIPAVEYKYIPASSGDYWILMGNAVRFLEDNKDAITEIGKKLLEEKPDAAFTPDVYEWYMRKRIYGGCGLSCALWKRHE